MAPDGDGLLRKTDEHGLLRRIEPDTLARLQPYFELVELNRRQVLFSAGDPLDHVFFITRGLVSSIKSLSDGRIVEVGTAGAGGVCFYVGLLGFDHALTDCLVQIPGWALRIKTSVLRLEMERDPSLRRLMREYAEVRFNQLIQTAVCNRLHSLEQRFCRWLLVAHDNAGSGTFHVTHETLALMLGVQRPGVSLAAEALQRAGAIQYQNGAITVLRRSRLETGACECYGAVRGQLLQLFGPQPSFDVERSA